MLTIYFVNQLQIELDERHVQQRACEAEGALSDPEGQVWASFAQGHTSITYGASVVLIVTTYPANRFFSQNVIRSE